VADLIRRHVTVLVTGGASAALAGVIQPLSGANAQFGVNSRNAALRSSSSSQSSSRPSSSS
jgi:hypothetical protein